MRFGLDPQAAGEELERIKRRDGTIGAPAVVEEARPDDAILHPAFTWSDPEAAEKYRLIEARTLIKKVRVICPEPTQEPVVRATVGMVSMPIEPLIEQHDPLAHDLSKAVGSLVEAKRQLEELKRKAAVRWDKKKEIAAKVAIAEMTDAEESLSSAHEALTAGRKAARWEVQGR